MSKLTRLMFIVFLVSLPATYFVWLPAFLSCLVFMLFWVGDRDEREKLTVPQAPETVDLTGVWSAITKLEQTSVELRSEVNALNLRAGLGK